MMTAGQMAGRKIAAGFCLSLFLVGCAHLPAAAPTTSSMEQAGSENRTKLNYIMLNLNEGVVHALAAYNSPGLAASFGMDAYNPTLAMRVGDTISITIFETGVTTLFGGAPQGGNALVGQTTGHAVTLPPQMIDVDGKVVVPYAGRVSVAGLTPQQADLVIARALAGSAAQPQVIISVVGSQQNMITVGGDVGHPGTVPLTLREETVLDAIAASGGAKYEAYETDVQLIRHGVSATVRLQRILDDPRENIDLQPGDQIFVVHDPRTFTVLGSAQRVSEYNFSSSQETLAEAVAQSGGPVDIAGDAGGIFLFRFEPKGLVQSILPPTDPRQGIIARAAAGAYFPVIYRLNLRRANGYFLAKATQMRNKDLVLVANADATQLLKLLAVVRGFTGIYYDVKRTVP